MAKFNIEVNLDWLNEEGDIEQIIKDAVVESITKRVSSSAVDSVQKKVNDLVNAEVENAVNERLKALLEDFLSRPRVITDKWGDVVREDVSVLTLLKEQCDAFIDGYVDKDGNSVKGSYYGNQKQRRIDYIIEKNIDTKMKGAVNSAADQIKIGMQKYIDATLTAKIGENVAKVIGIDKITAKMFKD